jgi:hypothetical protein
MKIAAEKLPANGSINTDNSGDKIIFNEDKIPQTGGGLSEVSLKWSELLQVISEDAYSIKELDKIGDKITGFIGPAISWAIEKYNNTFSKYLDGNQNIKNSFYDKNIKIYKNANRKSSINYLYNGNKNLNNWIEREFNAEYYNIYKSSNYLLSLKNMTGGALSKSLPFLGVGIDLVLIAKNLNEAWVNASKIINDLPLNKLGINRNDALIPSFGNIENISKKLDNLALIHKNNVELLKDIVLVAKTLKAYSSDFISIFINALAFLIDLIDYIPGGGFILSLILSIPLIISEYKIDKNISTKYDKVIEYIRSNAEEMFLLSL